MPDPSLSMSMDLDDDLPRTVRRERDARERENREREQREREARERDGREREAREHRERAHRDRDLAASSGPAFGSSMGPSMGHASMHTPQPMRMDHDDADLPAPPATVTAFDVPFVNLMFFFLKAVVAGIPALILLGVVLWSAGHVMQTFFPALLKLKIMIYVPQL